MLMFQTILYNLPNILAPLFILTRNISPTMTELNSDTFWHFSPTADAKILISPMRPGTVLAPGPNKIQNESK